MAKKKKVEPNATPFQLTIDACYIWPSGELGKIKFIKDNSVMELTLAQAKSLAEYLTSKLVNVETKDVIGEI